MMKRPENIRTRNARNGVEGTLRTIKTTRLRRWIQTWPSLKTPDDRRAKNLIYAELMWRKEQRG